MITTCTTTIITTHKKASPLTTKLLTNFRVGVAQGVLLWFDDKNMAASSYREYEVEAKDMVEKLLFSTLERVKKEQRDKVSEWPRVGEYSNESAQQSIERLIKVSQ